MASPQFETITIIGVGLLGGSLGLACKERGIGKNIRGFGRSISRLEAAQKKNIIDEVSTGLKEAVIDADLVVLCTPVKTIPDFVQKMAPDLKEGCLVTDVGSVKGSLIQKIEQQKSQSVTFVGSHPIAGGEKSGFEESQANLYEGVRVVVTPTDKTDRNDLHRIIEFWKGLGAEVTQLSPEEHDRIYSGVSHLPHAIAFALMNAIGRMNTSKNQPLGPFCGNGLIDHTRLASSDPMMWKDIFLTNKNFLLEDIKTFRKVLDAVSAGIERQDEDFLLNTLREANAYRAKLPKRKV